MSGEIVVAEMASHGIAAPVILMSGHAMPTDGPIGHLTFLEKPFSVADLHRAIETARGAATALSPVPGADAGPMNNRAAEASLAAAVTGGWQGSYSPIRRRTVAGL